MLVDRKQHPFNNNTASLNGPWTGLFDHCVDSGEMPDTVSCKNNGASYDTTWIPAKGSWISHHGMSIPDHAVKNAQMQQEHTGMGRADYPAGAISRKRN